MQPGNERLLRADPSRHGGNSTPPTLVALFPVSVVAQGPSTQSVERLMGLQSSVSRLVVLLTGVRWPRLRLPRQRLQARRIQ
jgi:hypothetical protein